MFITNSPAPSRINSAELPQRDFTVWEFAIFGYFPCIIRTVRTRSFNHKHKHRKMAIFCYFFSRFFCSLNWEFSYSNWEKNILSGIRNTTEYRSSKRAKKTPGMCVSDIKCHSQVKFLVLNYHFRQLLGTGPETSDESWDPLPDSEQKGPVTVSETLPKELDPL